MWAKFKAWVSSAFGPKKQSTEIKDIGKPPEMTPQAGPWVVPSYSIKSSRNVLKELEKLIDNELLKIAPDSFRAACEKKDANKLVALAGDALSSMKVREKTGNNDGYIVEMIQKVYGGSRGDAWCMGEQQVLVGYAEKKTGKVSKMPCSGSCASVRARAPKEIVIEYKDSQAGDVWIWMHPSGSGHTGNFRRWIKLGQTAQLNEGNTTAGKIGDKIVREGGGAYLTERAAEFSSSAYMRLKMVVRPFGA